MMYEAGVVMLSKAKHVDLIDRRSVRHIIRDSSLRCCLRILYRVSTEPR